MAGAQVMVLGMDIASTSPHDLRDCGNIVRFLQTVNLYEMEPHDELAAGDTQYVLARSGQEYVAYTAHATGQIGLKKMKAGNYHFSWLDCATNRHIPQGPVEVIDGDGTWDVPRGFGSEIAVYIRHQPDCRFFTSETDKLPAESP